MKDSTYTPEIAAEIVERLSSGESLRRICRGDGFPPESTVRGWVMDNREGFAAAYNRARALQVECWADEIVETAFDDAVDPQAARVRVDALRWLLSKLKPQRYGERLLLAGDTENPLQVLHQQATPLLARLNADQLQALLALCEAAEVEQERVIEHKPGDGAVLPAS